MKNLFKTFFLIPLLLINTLSVLANPIANVPKIKNIRVREVVSASGSISYKIVVIVKHDDLDEVANVRFEIEPVSPEDAKPCQKQYLLPLDKELSTANEKYYSVPCDLTAERGICLFGKQTNVLTSSFNVKATMLNKDGKTPWEWSSSSAILRVDTKDDKACSNDIEIEEIVFSTRGLGTTDPQLGFTVSAKDGVKKLLWSGKHIEKGTLTCYMTAPPVTSNTATIALNFITENCKGVANNYVNATLNSKTGLYEATFEFTGDEKCPFAILAINVGVTNQCSETKVATVDFNNLTGFGTSTIAFGFDKWKASNSMTDYKVPNVDVDISDSCDTNYSLSNVAYTTSNAGNIYTMSFNLKFDKGSDNPTNVVLVAQLTNCKGEKINVKVSMNYDSKTKSYVGGQGIPQIADCPWVLTYAEIGAYNPCGKLTAFSVDIVNAKGNGSGTKNASSAISARPQLL